MKELKYIVVSDREHVERAIVFDPKLIHRDVAKIHSASHGPRVISAGFCLLFPEAKAYGMSESLHLESRPVEDTAILVAMLS